MEELKVCKSFFYAMAVLSAGGKVRNKGWSKDAISLEIDNSCGFPVIIFTKKTVEGIEKIAWSPSLADFCGEWEILEPAKENIEDTFGYAISQLFEKNWFEVRHKNWSGDKSLTLEKQTITRLNDFNIEGKGLEEIEYYNLILDNGDRSFYYLPTVPDILRKEWIIIED